ncbi:MAG: hypothetical protein MUD00_01400 [Candidatus Pacebacteria bacterium]|jgi:flagellar biosynthesis/type III secretory pathway M-ring protein FliF/YscJ|nr:hypothetical protein [Candidatus Paceibacterota bacterium]
METETNGFPDWAIVSMITVFVAIIAVIVIRHGHKPTKRGNANQQQQPAGGNQAPTGSTTRPKGLTIFGRVIVATAVCIVGLFCLWLIVRILWDSPSSKNAEVQYIPQSITPPTVQPKVLIDTTFTAMVSPTKDTTIYIPSGYIVSFDSEPIGGEKLYAQDEHSEEWVSVGKDVTKGNTTHLSQHTKKLRVKSREKDSLIVRFWLKRPTS